MHGGRSERDEMQAVREDPLKRAQFVASIDGCARCHGPGHHDLTWLPLTHPSEAGDWTFTHWAMCPFTDQPILWAVGPE